MHLLVWREKSALKIEVRIATAKRRPGRRAVRSLALSHACTRLSYAARLFRADTARLQSMGPSANRTARPSGLLVFRWNPPVATFDWLDLDPARSDAGRLACAQSLCRSQDDAGPTTGMYSTDQGEKR